MGDIVVKHTRGNDTYYCTAGEDADHVIPTTLNMPNSTSISVSKTYITKIRKGNSSSYNDKFYYSAISPAHLQPLFCSGTIKVGGTDTKVLAPLHVYNETSGTGLADYLCCSVVGTGGKAGSNTNYLGGGRRTGGGGGGGGGGVMHVTSSYPISYSASHSTDGTFSLVLTSNGYTVQLVGKPGGNGSSGESVCTMGNKSGGGGGGNVLYIGSTKSLEDAHGPFQFWHGPMHVVGAVAKGGSGGVGQNDGGGAAGNYQEVSTADGEKTALGASYTWTSYGAGAGGGGGGGAGFFSLQGTYGRGGNRNSSETSGGGSSGTTGAVIVCRQNSGTNHVYTTSGWIS